jgi:hypothetical protein
MFSFIFVQEDNTKQTGNNRPAFFPAQPASRLEYLLSSRVPQANWNPNQTPDNRQQSTSSGLNNASFSK